MKGRAWREGESTKGLTIFAEEMKFAEFFQARGRLAKSSSVGGSRQLPRRGSQERGLSIKRLFDEKMPDCCSAAPHHLALQGASPRGEALTQGKTSHFCRKMKFTEFFSGKGKTCKDLFSRQKPTASPTGKPGTRVELKRLFAEKMPDCCSAAPHHLALQGASPQGEALECCRKNEGTEFFSGKGKAWKEAI